MQRRRVFILFLYLAAHLAAVGCVLPIGQPIQWTNPVDRTASVAVYVDSAGHAVTRTFEKVRAINTFTAGIGFSRVNVYCLVVAMLFVAMATGLLLWRSRKPATVA